MPQRPLNLKDGNYKGRKERRNNWSNGGYRGIVCVCVVLGFCVCVRETSWQRAEWLMCFAFSL